MPWYGAEETGRLPSTATWNFAISRVLRGNFVLDATYTGARERIWHLIVSTSCRSIQSTRIWEIC